MKIKVFGSSSAGNAYLISDGMTEILLECGLKWNDLRVALSFKMPDACILSHSHGDHAKAHKELSRAGVDIYLSNDTKKELIATGHRYKACENLVTFKVGTFFITPLQLQHDVPCFGYQIQSDITGETLAFLTDTFYCKYRLRNIDYYMIECNYIKEKLDKRLQDGSISEGQYNRTTRSHMSIETVKEFFRHSDLKRLQKVILIHLSDSNSDEKQMIQEVNKITNCPVYAAESGQVYEWGF